LAFLKIKLKIQTQKQKQKSFQDQACRGPRLGGPKAGSNSKFKKINLAAIGFI